MRVIEWLFFGALVFLPFTSIAGIPGLGEIQHELAAYFLLAAMGFSVFQSFATPKAQTAHLREPVYLLPQLMIVILLAVGVSFAANFLTIKDSVFLGRSGLEKFFSSTIVLFYGGGIAWMTYALSKTKSWDLLIMRPLAISVALCAAFSAFELAGRFSGGMMGLFKLISAPVYGNLPILEWDTRLRSVAFEPPDFANSAGYIWPWLLGAVLASKGSKRAIMFGAWLVLNGMILLSQARTSYVVIGGMIGVFVMLLFLFAKKEDGRDPEKMLLPMTLLILLVVPSLVLLFSFFYDDMIASVVGGDNVSNLSRLASITAALRMFEANPVFGLGFGQYGFHVTNYMPNWGYYSPEIKMWLFGAVQYWPSVYSVYARFAADMGFWGLLMWVGIWLFLARALIIETMRYRKATGQLPMAAFPLIMSCFGVLFAGVPCDSVRSPMIWINMGLACRYLYTLRVNRITPQKGTSD